MQVLLPLIVIISVIINVSGSGCYNEKEEELEKYFSTKTPYRVVANRVDKPLKFEGDNIFI